ncbi:hypothetical protein DDR33_01920 [Pararcticibacter amylolyticus]|uniref:Uncharacterized protein n=1 Tax=Pararcticibacter amylolyticus TaxID=2173175 RepID=A0A2U2PML9_9SPHI|nr:hypothetical protein DDR33_01920 [Pararcticibacter amylolyticus]
MKAPGPINKNAMPNGLLLIIGVHSFQVTCPICIDIPDDYTLAKKMDNSPALATPTAVYYLLIT